MLIAMVAIMIVAVGIDKGTEYFENKKWEKERVQRYEEAYAEVSDIQVTISELSQSQEAIEAFIEENKEYFEEAEFGDTQDAGGSDRSLAPEESLTSDVLQELPEDESASGNIISGNTAEEDTISENAATDSLISENTVSENGFEKEEGIGESISQNTVSSNELTEETKESVSENTVSGNNVPEEMYPGVSENTVSENSPQQSVSENTVSGNGMQGSPQITVSGNALDNADLTLQERRERSTSYIETQIVNEKDKQIIASSQVDFSDVKIACLGDSLTAATNLEKMENYQQYSYPAKLGALLHAEEVYNLGIGGSSVGRYWENAFVDRYREIPRDTDIIIVMGGTNDGFCVTREDLGNIQERAPRTFIGDLDELMRGLKADYPDAMIVFATPLPNVLHDMLRKERDYLLPQKEIVDAIKLLGEEYNIPVIDLYNSNLLDSHDAAVIYNYMPDGVHGNELGYQILAEHMAAELIGLCSGME